MTRRREWVELGHGITSRIQTKRNPWPWTLHWYMRKQTNEQLSLPFFSTSTWLLQLHHPTTKPSLSWSMSSEYICLRLSRSWILRSQSQCIAHRFASWRDPWLHIVLTSIYHSTPKPTPWPITIYYVVVISLDSVRTAPRCISSALHVVCLI